MLFFSVFLVYSFNTLTFQNAARSGDFSLQPHMLGDAWTQIKGKFRG